MGKRVAFAIFLIVFSITHCRNTTEDNDKTFSLSNREKVFQKNPTSAQMQYSLKPDSKKKTMVERSSAARKHCKCGVSNRSRKRINNRIINGKFTRKNEYPWQVGIVDRGESGDIMCGGSIISSRTILTAAHCMFDYEGKIITTSRLYVVLGEHDVTKRDGEVNYNVYFKVVHPNYNKVNKINKYDYDFAILILRHDIRWNHRIKPVCLPSSNTHSTMFENRNSVVSGWGTIDPQLLLFDYKLKKAYVRTKTNKWCSRALHFNHNITPRMLCAIGNNQDTCRGDSGGPLVIEAGSRANKFYILAGITSWASGMCNTPGEPGVYARVTNQLPWIEENMRGFTCPRPSRRRHDWF